MCVILHTHSALIYHLLKQERCWVIFGQCAVALVSESEQVILLSDWTLLNIWIIRRSHATNPLLLAPTQPTFPLDFAQLLQATAANPSRTRARIVGTRARVRSETIIEEDDGWDLI